MTVMCWRWRLRCHQRTAGVFDEPGYARCNVTVEVPVKLLRVNDDGSFDDPDNLKTLTGTLGPRLYQASASTLRQLCMMLAILFLLKTMESLQNGVAIDFQATPLFSLRTLSLASLLSCLSIDANVLCKRTLSNETSCSNNYVIRQV